VNRKQYEARLNQMNVYLWDFVNACQREATAGVEMACKGHSQEEVNEACSAIGAEARAAWEKARQVDATIWRDIHDGIAEREHRRWKEKRDATNN
jgi:hypothetical protein